MYTYIHTYIHTYIYIYIYIYIDSCIYIHIYLSFDSPDFVVICCRSLLCFMMLVDCLLIDLHCCF